MRRTGMGSDLQKPAADEGVAVLPRSLDGVLEGADAMVFPVPGRLRRTVFPSPEGRPDEETKLPDPGVEAVEVVRETTRGPEDLRVAEGVWSWRRNEGCVIHLSGGEDPVDGEP